MRKLVVLGPTPREELWWLAHGRRVDAVACRIRSDELMQPEGWNGRVKDQGPGNSVKGQEVKVCMGI
jgi:hypothetical protein